MTVERNIIFKIGSSGAAGTVAAFAAVGASILATGKKFKEGIVEAEKFGQIIRRNKIDMSLFNSATKGLIGTTESYIGANKLAAAGAKFTAQNLADIGKLSIENARAMGMSATQAFEHFTTAVSKGSSRAFRAIGIDLENTEDLVLAQAEALEKISAKYGGLNIEVETATERFYRFENAVGTVQNQLTLGALESFGDALGDVNGIFGDLIKSVEEFSDDIAVSNGALAKWVMSADGAKWAAQMLGNQIADTLIPFTNRFSDNIKTLNKNLDITRTKFLVLGRMGSSMKTQFESMDLKTPEQRALDIEAQNKKDLEAIKKLEEEWDRDHPKKPRKEYEPTAQDIVEPRRMETVDLMMQQMQQQIDAEVKAQEDKIKEEEKLEKEKNKMMKRLDEERLRDIKERTAAELQMRREADSAMMASLSQLSSFQGSENERAFNIGKAAAIAETTIQTYKGAQGAASALAPIPIVGPALAVAAATAFTAAGVARVKKIASTKYGGKGGPTKSTGGNISPMSSNNSVSAGQSQDTIDRRPIQVVIDGRMVTDVIVEDAIRSQKRGERGLMVRTN